jgi:NADPH:quinone reductase-like Zn-dependent oxidoreductase
MSDDKTGGDGTMRAVQYDSYGPAEVLRVRTVPVPRVRPGTLLVRVAATSVNAADVAVRSGRLRLLSGRKFPRGTGFDFSGEVVEVGEGVTGFQVGDGVWGFLRDLRSSLAAAAEYLVVPVTRVALRPTSLDDVAAAALSGAGGAALGVVRDGLRVRAGERVLVRGGAGGVGSAAVQLAHAAGARVAALVSAKHLDLVREIGADEAFDYRATDPRELGRFDVVIDTVSRDLRCYRPLLTRTGRMGTLNVESAGGAAYLVGSTVFGRRRVRFLQFPPDGRLLAALTDQVDAKAVRAVVDSVYPLDDIVGAHRSFEAGGGFGKYVIQVT